MTDAEVTKMFGMVKATYPRFFSDLSKQQIANYIDAWNYIFADKDADKAFKGLMWCLTNDTKGYPPTPGQIIEAMSKLEPENTMNELEAWRLVEKAVRNSLYNSELEFMELPRTIKKVIRDPGRLKEWAKMDIEEFNTVIQSNFLRSFRMEQQREHEAMNVPVSMRPLLTYREEEPLEIEVKIEKEKGDVPDDDINDMIERLRKWDAT